MEFNLEALDNLLDNMGKAPAPAPAPAPTTAEPPKTDPAPAPAPAPAQAEPPKTDPAPAPAPNADNKETPPANPPTEEEPEDPAELFKQVPRNKQNEAFAEMRVTNKQLTGLLKDIGRVLGVQNVDDMTALQGYLRNQIINLQAQQQQVPPQLLQQQYQQQQELTAAQSAMLETQATLGFQKVKDTYTLTQKDLATFSKQLIAEGKNPYTQPLDLVAEYRRINFDAILKKANDAAVQEALQRQAKAQESSTKPNSATGNPPATPQAINTVAGLDALLANYGGK